MADQTAGSSPESRSLPDHPDLDWLRKQAKRLLDDLRRTDADATLARAQFALAKQYRFASWRALKAHVDSLSVDGQLFDAARAGHLATLTAGLDAHPDKLNVRAKPYEMSLLHLAAMHGHLPCVDLLLRRGLDVNVLERGDRTYPMHWAAAAGHLEVVRRLADAGGDVVGRGDDHELEVIGWAACWERCHDAIVDLLVSRGARHHIYSAMSRGLADEVRRIVRADPIELARPMSRNENHQRPLHYAVRKNLMDMVALLLELGADPQATDDAGYTAVIYAAAPETDRRVLEMLARTAALDLTTAVALGDWGAAARLLAANPRLLDPGGAGAGALPLMAKRGDVAAVTWLLARGANPNARWPHWDAEVTPLHLAVWQAHTEVVRLLLDAGADPRICDSKYDGDAVGWARHFGHTHLVALLDDHEAGR